MATQAAGEQLIAARLPAWSTTSLVALEWTSEIVRWASTSADPFRMNVTYMSHPGTGSFLTALQGQLHRFENLGYGDVPEAGLGLGLYTSSQFQAPGVGLTDGVDLRALPERAPRFAVAFENGDNQGHTWTQVYSRSDLAPRPNVLRFKARLLGKVTDPVGNYARSYVDGSWQPLVGDFAVWNLRVEIESVWTEIANYFVPWSRVPYLKGTDAGPTSLFPEWFYTVTGGVVTTALAVQPVEVVYSGLRAFDASTSAWHELLDYKISVSHKDQYAVADTDSGWSVARHPGKLSSLGGTGDTTLETDVGRYALSGCTYSRGDTGAALSFTSIGNTSEGAATYNGPIFGGPAAPYIQQDADRGYYVLNPASTTGTCILTFPIPYAGTWTFTGDFDRANTNSGSGGGSDVLVVAAGSTLFSAHVSNTAVVDPDLMFTSAANQSFAVSSLLAAGDSVKFIVAGTATGFDTTAFRFFAEHVRSGTSRTPVPKGDDLYVPPGWMFQSTASAVGGFGKRVAMGSLRHEVFFFDDADDAELWRSLPDGAVAVAMGQSESDASADVQPFLNDAGQVEFATTAGSRKLWIHLWMRASRRPGASGTDTPPVASGPGYLPKGTGLFSNDLTLAGDNLANGRIVGSPGYRHRVYGFRDLVNGDWWVGGPGIVVTAFQAAFGKRSFVKTKIVARDRSSTTVSFATTASAEIDGWLHVWSR